MADEYKKQEDMTAEEHEAYKKGYDSKINGLERGATKDYNHNLWLCFCDGWNDATELLRVGMAD